MSNKLAIDEALLLGIAGRGVSGHGHAFCCECGSSRAMIGQLNTEIRSAQAEVTAEKQSAEIGVAGALADHPISFSASEVAALMQCPQAINSLADWHEAMATGADAIGEPEVFGGSIAAHEKRRDELRAYAILLEGQM